MFLPANEVACKSSGLTALRYHAQGLRIHQIDGLPGSEGKDAVEGFVKVVLVGFQIYMPDMGRAQAIFQAQQGVAGQYRLAVPDIDSRHAEAAVEGR